MVTPTLLPQAIQTHVVSDAERALAEFFKCRVVVYNSRGVILEQGYFNHGQFRDAVAFVARVEKYAYGIAIKGFYEPPDSPGEIEETLALLFCKPYRFTEEKNLDLAA
jgi:hypothetical protein